MGFVPVFSEDLFLFDDQLGGVGIGEFAVDEHIADDLPENPVPQVDSLVTFQVKFFRQMFGYEFHQPVVAFNQAYADIITVIV